MTTLPSIHAPRRIGLTVLVGCLVSLGAVALIAPLTEVWWLAALAPVAVGLAAVVFTLTSGSVWAMRQSARLLEATVPGASTRLRVRMEDSKLASALEAFLEHARTELAGRQKARLEAEAADRLETRFLTNMSHELRTPLNAILGFSQVLLDEIDGPLSPSQREDVQAIQGSGKHLSSLVDDVLDLAALQSRRVKLELEELELGPIVEEVARLLEAQRRRKQVEVRTRVAEGLPVVRADPKRVRQIIMNLGTNALKFTQRGHVLIECAAEDGGVRITVEDTGPGIPRSELDSIFREFTQAPTPRRGTQGAGLGLSICKHLTELHEGDISVESTLGVGSRFSVSLPRGAKS